MNKEYDFDKNVRQRLINVSKNEQQGSFIHDVQFSMSYNMQPVNTMR